MKKTLTIATLLSLMAVPSFAQSFDPDIGSGNIVPPAANQGGANAYAQAPFGPYAYDYSGLLYNYGGHATTTSHCTEIGQSSNRVL